MQYHKAVANGGVHLSYEDVMEAARSVPLLHDTHMHTHPPTRP